MSNTTTNPADELKAMTTIAEALTPLDADATGRVLRWAAERFGTPLRLAKTPNAAAHQDADDEISSSPKFETFAEFYAAASPGTDAERALVTGYWFQYTEGMTEFGAQAINTALKDLGHRVSNITNAFGALKVQKPQLVVQLRKSGSSKQARKTYKLTTAGKTAVEAMIGATE